MINLVNPKQKPHFGQEFESGHWSRKGLVGHWPFIRHGKLIDVSGNGNHGDINDALWKPGRNGYALDFDGTNDYVDISAIGNDMDTFVGTVSAWIKLGVMTGNGFLFEVRVDGPNNMALSWGETSAIFTYKYKAGDVLDFINTSNISDTDGLWHHVAMTWDKPGADELKAYLNGAQEGATQTSLGTWVGTPIGANIGRNLLSAAYIIGLIDNVRIYNRVLLPSEIEELYWNEYPEYAERHAPVGVIITSDMWQPEIQRPYPEILEVVDY